MRERNGTTPGCLWPQWKPSALHQVSARASKSKCPHSSAAKHTCARKGCHVSCESRISMMLHSNVHVLAAREAVLLVWDVRQEICVGG